MEIVSVVSVVCDPFGCFLSQRFQAKLENKRNLHPATQAPKFFLCFYPRDPTAVAETLLAPSCFSLLRVPFLTIKFSSSYEGFPPLLLSLLFQEWSVWDLVFNTGILSLSP